MARLQGRRALKLCACGKPLHYADASNWAKVERLVALLGEFVCVRLSDGTGYEVPRHYIALHGIKAQELPELAERYQWNKTE